MGVIYLLISEFIQETFVEYLLSAKYCTIEQGFSSQLIHLEMNCLLLIILECPWLVLLLDTTEIGRSAVLLSSSAQPGPAQMFFGTSKQEGMSRTVWMGNVQSAKVKTSCLSRFLQQEFEKCYCDFYPLFCF